MWPEGIREIFPIYFMIDLGRSLVFQVDSIAAVSVSNARTEVSIQYHTLYNTLLTIVAKMVAARWGMSSKIRERGR